MVVVRRVRSFVMSVLFLLIVRATVRVGNKEGVRETGFWTECNTVASGLKDMMGESIVLLIRRCVYQPGVAMLP